MTENVVGTISYPFSVAVNFMLNGKDIIIPMAGEEPSVVAAASNMARIMRNGPGIRVTSSQPIMIGQIQLTDVPDMAQAIKILTDKKQQILQMANEVDPVPVNFGGGAKDLELRPLDTRVGPMLICHLLVDCRDAMGANIVRKPLDCWLVKVLSCEIEENGSIKGLGTSRLILTNRGILSGQGSSFLTNRATW